MSAGTRAIGVQQGADHQSPLLASHQEIPMTSTFDSELTENLSRLRSMATMMTKDRPAADDLLQDTLMRMLKAQASYEPGSNLLGWAYRIMQNRHISLIRRKRHDMHPLDSPAALLVGHRPSQEGHIESNELRFALAHLPSDQRLSVLLVGGWGYGYAEVASMLNVSIGTIKSRVSRARERLRDRLRPVEVGSDARLEM
jgi:RNA polymerase sigma-70 factor (ECF subfamily)